MIRCLTAGLTLLGMTGQALACTAVDIVARDNSVIAGRTMEWAFEMDWTLRSFPKGAEIALTAPAALGLPERKVAAAHAFVGVSAEIIPGGAVLEGQNDAGLGMSGNFLPGFTEYQEVTAEDQNYVSILRFGEWALGMHGSVAELRAALPGIKVWADASLPSGPTPPTIHMVFTDRSGAGMIVEYVGGVLQIRDNAAHVLTNAPTYDWHLLNLRNYLNLSTMGVMQRATGRTTLTALGQGGGMTGMAGDYTSPSRFVRAAFLRENVERPADAAAAAQAVAHILNTVDVPMGVVQSAEGSEVATEYTQWVALKDLTNDRLMIADYAHRTTYLTLDLREIFAQTEPAAILVTDLLYPDGVDATAALRPGAVGPASGTN